MYLKSLRITIFGIDRSVEQTVRNCAPLERFEHVITVRPTLDAEAFCRCDIAIIDARAPEGVSTDVAPLIPSIHLASLVERQRACWSGFFRAVVVIADERMVSTWTAADYGLIDVLWMAPLDEARLAFEFARIQNAAKRDADLDLARQYLDTAIDSIPELVWFKDASGSHVKVNDAFCETVGKTKAQVEGRGHYYIWDITPDEYAQGEYVCLESEEETMRARRTCLFDEQVKTKAGMRQFKTYKSPLFDYDGSVMGTVGVAHDVTNLSNIETELEIFINSMPYAVVVLDLENRILNMNGHAEDYFAIKREEALGGEFDHWRRVALGDDVVDTHDFADSSFFTATIRGARRTFEVNQRAIKDVFDNVTGQLRIYRDVTNERELEERVVIAARTDYLTGLYNRRYFYEYLEKQRDGKPITLIAFDLDNFKSINDQFGHAAGDEALVHAAETLREAFPDGFVVRWGGDEFVVALLGVVALDETKRLVRDVLEEFQRYSAAGGSWRLAASAGIAATDDASLSIDVLIKRSDEALYQAKREGSTVRLAAEEV